MCRYKFDKNKHFFLKKKKKCGGKYRSITLTLYFLH